MDSDFQKKYINYFYFVKKEQKMLLYSEKEEGRLLVKFNLAFYESGNFAALKKVMYKMQNVLYKCMWVLHLAEIKIFPQKRNEKFKWN